MTVHRITGIDPINSVMIPRSIGAVSYSFTSGSIPPNRSLKSFDLIGLDINKEVAQGNIGEFVVESGAQITVDLADRSQHRKAEPEREDDVIASAS